MRAVPYLLAEMLWDSNTNAAVEAVAASVADTGVAAAFGIFTGTVKLLQVP